MVPDLGDLHEKHLLTLLSGPAITGAILKDFIPSESGPIVHRSPVCREFVTLNHILNLL